MESNVMEAEKTRTQMIDAAIGSQSKITSDFCLPPSTFKKIATSTGVRISTQINGVNEEISKGVEGFNGVKNLDNLASVESNMKFKEEMIVGCEGNESKECMIFDVGNSDKKVEMVDDVEVGPYVRNKEEAVMGCEGDDAKGSEILQTEKSGEGEMVCDAMEVEPNLKIKERTFICKEENVERGSEFVNEDKLEKERDDMKVKEEKKESLAEDEVVDCKYPKGTVGKGNLSFYERLDLSENQSKVKKDSYEEVVNSKNIEIKKVHFEGCKNEEISEKATELYVIPSVKHELYAKVKQEAVIVYNKNESLQEKQGVRDCKIYEQFKGSLELSNDERFQSSMKKPQTMENLIVKEEKMEISMPEVKNEGEVDVKMKADETIYVQPLSARPLSDNENKRCQNNGDSRYVLPKQERSENRCHSTSVVEDGDFPVETDWLLVGRHVVIGISTSKGRKLENNEIVHFAFPNLDARYRGGSRNASSKAGSGIVRFSTKRNGEIGRLPMEWGNCLIPLVNSCKVKVLGRCLSAHTNLHVMQDIMLYLSFYIHHTVFTDGDKSSWRLDVSSHIDTTTYPLLTLFKLLKIQPVQKAEFTPEELDSRKRHHMFEGEVDENAPIVKRIKGVQPYTEHKEEQAVSESTLNKLVGASDMYDLQEMEAPDALTCYLRPYQKQALFWMTELEKCVNVEEATKTLHPCWGSYRICDERAPVIYVNAFSGEATTNFPSATKTARGGILADAMGLGKTVMTIALLLAIPGRGIPEKQESDKDMDDTEYIMNKRKDRGSDRPKVRGGTLIVCPMALLGQWKDELEAHSKPDCLSVCVYYGGDRSNNPNVMAGPDVILTTYGVLNAAYKNNGEDSIFHRVDWHRVVLDEAHTIKSSRTLIAHAAFALSSYCRWCLTGTPLQNNLEDLYSLLCFLHVEPWCNWAWWQKLIQKPYENGDLRGLKLVKAILRPLMLRRTKETKDREGRPILVLPPTDIKITMCEQSEAEHDFYDALFKRSKVQFDQFVAQGKVLHNYANILELLLRLRQCCNHPFLVMSRGDTQKFADLNKLARRFFETNSDSNIQNVPSRAYVEEVVEGLRNGENTECPICLESADDPVLTPCAHKMCRECLLSSWRSLAGGACPICRQLLKKTELITCPSENRFRIDIEKNWKESSKISKLLNALEQIRRSGSGEKSIIFSQWTSFFDLLEIPLRKRKIGFLRFDGKLAQKQRERVLKEFNETGEKMVLLMSLKAGGVGLNLTAASNVFIMDPWWNPAVEEQAIMRIHRIGQKRTVHVRRFIVKDTVEERMQQVQARKQRMIAGALTDEEVRSARIEELKMLFR